MIWGTYVPEFGIAIGVEDGKYHVKTFKEMLKEEQPPIPYDGIDAPGGPYVLAFPTPTEFKDKKWLDKYFVQKGVRLLQAKSLFPKYGNGLEAYDWWIKALESNTAHDFGNSYNSQCWCESKVFAREFLSRIAERNEMVGEPLKKAIKHYKDTTKAMGRVAEIFPFPPGEQLKDEKNRTDAIKALQNAKAAETLAVKAMDESLKIDWEK